ncbi:MAG TPA: hypothetical protein VMX37_06855 [Acidimicrobiia bacterium]|nr:hypothetical protein [Acidimicrobiia bacterium]
MRRRLIPLLALVALVAVACGDDESVFDQGGATTTTSTGTGEETTTTGAQTTSTEATTTTQATSTTLGGGEQALADQIAADLLAEGDSGLPVDEASAQCLGGQIVATFGVARLQELDAAAGGEGGLGSALELMTPEEQSTLIGVILNGAEGQAPCVDVQAFIVDSLTQSGLSADSAACVAEAFTQGSVLQDLVGSVLAGGGAEGEMDPEVATQLMTVLMGCLTPEELADMGGVDLGS